MKAAKLGVKRWRSECSESKFFKIDQVKKGKEMKFRERNKVGGGRKLVRSSNLEPQEVFERRSNSRRKVECSFSSTRHEKWLIVKDLFVIR